MQKIVEEQMQVKSTQDGAQGKRTVGSCHLALQHPPGGSSKDEGLP